MNFSNMTNVINSTIRESSKLRNFEKEIERGLDYENLEAIKRIADSAESQAKSSAVQAELAVKQSQKADIKSWVAIFISIFTLIVEFMAYHEEIFSFMLKIFN
ncbi:hypothetical protein V1226_26140 [Lachnospiraceae bacterium JLR.KK009]|nr:hypothetical protein C810_05153 [Lachnospiraceae bacterium A2]